MSHSGWNSSEREILVGFGVDVDAVAGWLGSYGGHDSPGDISRGMYAGEVGTIRLLRLFERFGIKTTWFIPGHSLETFPDQMAVVRDAGHEMHRLAWLLSRSSSSKQQRDILDRTYTLLTDFCGGIPPKGSVAPWWETSKEGTELLLEKGIEYDHSNMAHDSQAFYLRDADDWTPIDYSTRAETWMKPLKRGNETGIVEIPANWYLDDLPPMMFIKASPNSHGWVSTRDVEDLWKDTFTYLYRRQWSSARSYDAGKYFSHILVSQPSRPILSYMRFKERFITWINTHESIKWVPMIEMARAFRAKKQPVPGARMPTGFKPDASS
ncbi:uncharacterized protein FOMMEDRAFT_151340 [Fomitiporia mediterranea MF3/22]|uniref:uncharacterized protein n=1 Tax=Fomitiporia mediterranea (strain MF3/22) TaxID=694068 RepID=UPI00044093AF|nr:uncharacterized protein FOMMEDRAFT_151340 [Fomitiporia mediterranea MF3/22]EJD08475.1 hypothetical protein FOMMEDRAFT_151340 [Fomitiporia mediterranea MF3/22]